MEGDWVECEQDLCYSANRDQISWIRHGEALIKLGLDEETSFRLLLKNFDEAHEARENFVLCRRANPHKFWKLARKYWDLDGWEPGTCKGIQNKDSVYFW
ncbi:hypothetical protein HOF92_04395 [bacterium]|jgi:hypothetical protein|nr:hypothetical protein [bacterium]